jgi:hypothetical protein
MNVALKNTTVSLFNDWHFMPEGSREEYLSMSGNLLANTQMLIRTSHLYMVGYVFDMWNHTYEDKARDFLQALNRKVGKQELEEAYLRLLKAVKRTEPEQKMALFSTFYREVVGE